MKSQDVVILLKLISLEIQAQQGQAYSSSVDWVCWSDGYPESALNISPESYSMRNLSALTGIGKTEVSRSLKRSMDSELAKIDRNSGVPTANRKVLYELLHHSVKYVFPAQPQAVQRGVPTAFACPLLKHELLSAGEYIYVWPDAKGKAQGQGVEPLFPKNNDVVKQDPLMYKLLALVDAIRLGKPRESELAKLLLADAMKIN